jgi:hypothetical protein
MMVEQLAHARTCVALLLRPAGPRRSAGARRRDVRPYRSASSALSRARVAAAVLYWRAARTDRPPALALAAFASGSSSSRARSTRRLETIAAHYLLLIHLLQNALIADVAPLLVLLG